MHGIMLQVDHMSDVRVHISSSSTAKMFGTVVLENNVPPGSSYCLSNVCCKLTSFSTLLPSFTVTLVFCSFCKTLIISLLSFIIFHCILRHMPFKLTLPNPNQLHHSSVTRLSRFESSSKCTRQMCPSTPEQQRLHQVDQSRPNISHNSLRFSD